MPRLSLVLNLAEERLPEIPVVSLILLMLRLAVPPLLLHAGRLCLTTKWVPFGFQVQVKPLGNPTEQLLTWSPKNSTVLENVTLPPATRGSVGPQSWTATVWLAKSKVASLGLV